MAANRVSTLHRTAFVTGASTGLGRAFTEMLLAEGVRVWGTSRDPVRLGSVASAHPGAFTPVALDLRDAAAAIATFRAMDRDAGGFDLLVNNAGYGAFGEFATAEFESWRDQLEVMLVNTAALAHAALPGMLERRRGALVNISSLAAEFPLPFQPAYNMAKAGLTALSESLMIETRGTGVVVLDVRPGDYRTDFEGSVTRLPGSRTPRAARASAQRIRHRAHRALLPSDLGAPPHPPRAAEPQPAHPGELLRAPLRTACPRSVSLS